MGIQYESQRQFRKNYLSHHRNNNGLKVYDGRNKLLGYCENGITRRTNGQVVVYTESPGLLVDMDR